MNYKTIESHIENEFYRFSLVFEKLEHMGKLTGNGHHWAQYVSAYAKDILDKNWIGKR